MLTQANASGFLLLTNGTRFRPDAQLSVPCSMPVPVAPTSLGTRNVDPARRTGFEVLTLEPNCDHPRGGVTVAHLSQLSEPSLDDDPVGTNRTGVSFEFFDDVTLTWAPSQ